MTETMLTERYGPTALILGGSEGTGSSFARLLLRDGVDVVLVARTAATLETLAAELSSEFPEREITPVVADLSAPEGLIPVFEATGGREIGLLIYNAGAATLRRNYLDSSWEDESGIALLSVGNVMRAVHHYAPAMRDRGHGGILLMSSAAALAGLPGLATYSGAKAFMATFAEALWCELEPAGVDVSSLVVGAVATPAMQRRFPESQQGAGAHPDEVAEQALAELRTHSVTFTPDVFRNRDMLTALPRAEVLRGWKQRSGHFHFTEATGERVPPTDPASHPHD